MNENIAIAATVILGGVVLVTGVGGCMWGVPQYNVYSQRLEGEAAKARAESEKLIMVEQAKAELESAKLRAEAIEVMGESAKKYPE